MESVRSLEPVLAVLNVTKVVPNGGALSCHRAQLCHVDGVRVYCQIAWVVWRQHVVVEIPNLVPVPEVLADVFERPIFQNFNRLLNVRLETPTDVARRPVLVEREPVRCAVRIPCLVRREDCDPRRTVATTSPAVQSSAIHPASYLGLF